MAWAGRERRRSAWRGGLRHRATMAAPAGRLPSCSAADSPAPASRARAQAPAACPHARVEGDILRGGREGEGKRRARVGGGKGGQGELGCKTGKILLVAAACDPNTHGSARRSCSAPGTTLRSRPPPHPDLPLGRVVHRRCSCSAPGTTPLPPSTHPAAPHLPLGLVVHHHALALHRLGPAAHHHVVEPGGRGRGGDEGWVRGELRRAWCEAGSRLPPCCHPHRAAAPAGWQQAARERSAPASHTGRPAAFATQLRRRRCGRLT